MRSRIGQCAESEDARPHHRRRAGTERVGRHARPRRVRDGVLDVGRRDRRRSTARDSQGDRLRRRRGRRDGNPGVGTNPGGESYKPSEAELSPQYTGAGSCGLRRIQEAGSSRAERIRHLLVGGERRSSRPIWRGGGNRLLTPDARPAVCPCVDERRNAIHDRWAASPHN